jgi:hypothetical protein
MLGLDGPLGAAPSSRGRSRDAPERVTGQYSTIACRAQQQPNASVVRLQLGGDFAEQPAEPGYGGLVAVLAVP